MKNARPILYLGFVSLLLLAACSQSPAPEAELQSLSVDDRYIVVLNDTPNPRNPAPNRAEAAAVATAHGLQPTRLYGAAIVGFAAQIPTGRLVALQRDPRVNYIETDDPVRTFAQESPTGVRRVFADTNTNLNIDSTDDYRVDVDVAIIDTGIDYEHYDLDVVGGVDCSGKGPFNNSCKSGGDDDHYHGTHVAGSVAAIDDGVGVVGVAPGARLWAVKVLDSSGRGYESWVVAGIDWVAANSGTIEVANMSLGGSGFSQAEYDAIQTAVDNGVAFAVAAGNSDDDANNYSPAAFDNVLTVSALADFDGAAGGNGSPTCRDDQDDTLANFSNWGNAVQVAAPGVCIKSTYPIEQGEYGTISGTSMASPHGAGALALLASSNNPSNASDVHGLYDQVKNAGNSDWTDDSGDGIHEPLLDVSTFTATFSSGSGGGGDTNAAPSASFTYACTELSCSFDGSGSSDSDGTISSYAWDLGDGTSASGPTVSHTYGAGGTYNVILTVTDDAGATDSSSQSVSVSSGTTAITLSGSGYKVKGVQHADLAWSPSDTSTSVDIYRDGLIVATGANDGAHTDNIGNRGNGTYMYEVCEAGTTTCSNEVTVSFN